MNTVSWLLIGVLTFPIVFLFLPIDKGMGFGWSCVAWELCKQLRSRK